MIIKYIFLLICFCSIFTANRRDLRKESAVEDALYEELVRVIEAGWRVLKKVRKRIFYRYRKKFNVACSNGKIYLDGKLLLNKHALR